tara:strand:- start:4866 stop:5300 length:435 start_codon:yes stop_codon:yes gene_type:complete
VDTIREQVVKAIVARLDGLTAVDVLRRETYADEDEFVCVWDGEHDTEKTRYRTNQHTMPVVVEFLKADAVKPYAVAANAMYGQVMQALFNDSSGNPETTLGGLAESMTEVNAMVLTPVSGLKVIGCSVTIDVVFKTANGDPFSQ